jgi:hypothetical protein
VVAAENKTFARQTAAIGDVMDEVAKAHRCHAGIAAVLIDLVRSRFDKGERHAGPAGVAQRCLDYEGMRGAYGKHAARLSCPVTRNAVENGLHAKGCPKLRSA